MIAVPAGSVEYVDNIGHCTTAVNDIMRHINQRRSKYLSLASEWPVVPGV